jgi:hypothetical protein
MKGKLSQKKYAVYNTGSLRAQKVHSEVPQYKFIKINISSTYSMNVYTHIYVQTNIVYVLKLSQ